MAKRKKNKIEQTFDVYPYLGGTQHFMIGGATPRLHKLAAGDETPHVVDGEASTYEKPSTYNQWISDYDTSPSSPSLLGQVGSAITKGSDLVNHMGSVFDKNSYKPGGKYSKLGEDGLKYGKLSLTNTRDENALIDIENMNQYLDMNKKDQENVISSDIWKTPDEMLHGHRDFMNLDEDGNPTFKGMNFEVSKQRSEHYTNPDKGTCSKPEFTDAASCSAGGGQWTGDKLFGIKTRNEDGTFSYRNEKGDLIQPHEEGYKGTEYDQIEDKQGLGGLYDANADLLQFDFDKGTCDDGVSTTMEECASAGANWIKDDNSLSKVRHYGENEEGKTEESITDYDPDINFSDWKTKETVKTSKQDRINCELTPGCEWKVTAEGGNCDCGGGDEELLGGGCASRQMCDDPNNPGECIPCERYGGQLKYGGFLPKASDGWFDSLKTKATETFNKAKETYDNIDIKTPVNNALDYTQTALSAAGLTPAVGIIPDAVNTVISGVRTGHAAATGDTESAKKYGTSLALNAGSMIPVAGQAFGVTSLANDANNYATDDTEPFVKSVTTGITQNKGSKDNINMTKYGTELHRFVYGGNLPKFQGEENSEVDEELTDVEEENTFVEPEGEWATVNVGGQQVKVPFDQRHNYSSVPGQENSNPEQAGFAYQRASDVANQSNDAGIEASYGDTKVQKIWNKGREALNTGISGGILDGVIGGAGQEAYCSNEAYADKSACEEAGETWHEATKGTGLVDFAFENVLPMMNNIIGQNKQHQAELSQQGLSSENFASTMESSSSLGQMGTKDINKGGYGDDLYGTGEVFGQLAQQGVEMQQPMQQPEKDFTALTAFMNAAMENEGVRFNTEELDDQKLYNGKMKYGGALPKFQLKGGLEFDENGNVVKSKVLDLENESNKERKKRIKNYTHPYLQEYYDEFANSGISNEKTVRDIMSSMNVNSSDTLFTNKGYDANSIRSINNMNANQYIGSQLYDDGSGNWEGNLNSDNKQDYFTTKQDEDGLSWDFLTSLYRNSEGTKTGVLKSRKKYGGEQILDIDDATLKELIAAGADIEYI